MGALRLCFLLSVAVASGAAAPAFANDSAVDAPVRQVETGLLPRVALKENLGRPATLEQRMRELGIPGVSIAVIDEGKVAWARAYGLRDTVDKTPVTVETLFQAGSISKPIAAMGALRLIKEGKLSLDDDVNAKLKTWRVPENEFTKDEKVTLRRLMSHTAGLTVHGFPGYAIGTDIPTVVQVLDGQPPANTSPVRVDVRPGSVYRYSGGGYTVMQQLIADVSKEPFESFMQSKVLNVLGMTSSTYSQNPAPALAARRASAHRRAASAFRASCISIPKWQPPACGRRRPTSRTTCFTSKQPPAVRPVSCSRRPSRRISSRDRTAGSTAWGQAFMKSANLRASDTAASTKDSKRTWSATSHAGKAS